MKRKKRQYDSEEIMFEQMRIDYQLTRLRLLSSPVLHAAAGIPSEDFRGISNLLLDSQEEPEHYDTNLPLWFSEPSDIKRLLEYQERYPHIFENCRERGGLFRVGYHRWQLSWLGRAFFKEYPYQVDVTLETGKLQAILDCTFYAQTNGMPIFIFGMLTCEVAKHNTFNAFEYFVFGIEEDSRTDFDFDGVDIPIDQPIQLDTGAEVMDGKKYPVSFPIEIPKKFYEPYGELDIGDPLFGYDGTISCR